MRGKLILFICLMCAGTVGAIMRGPQWPFHAAVTEGGPAAPTPDAWEVLKWHLTNAAAPIADIGYNDYGNTGMMFGVTHVPATNGNVACWDWGGSGDYASWQTNNCFPTSGAVMFTYRSDQAMGGDDQQTFLCTDPGINTWLDIEYRDSAEDRLFCWMEVDNSGIDPIRSSTDADLCDDLVNRWAHICVVQDGSSAQPALYVDGLLVVWDGDAGTNNTYWLNKMVEASTPATLFRLGHGYNVTAGWEGKCASFQMWNQPLTAGMVFTNYMDNMNRIGMIPDWDYARQDMYKTGVVFLASFNNDFGDYSTNHHAFSSGDYPTLVNVKNNDDYPPNGKGGGDFNGSSDVINYAIGASYSNFTIAGWFNFDAFTAFDGLLTYRNGSNLILLRLLGASPFTGIDWLTQNAAGQSHASTATGIFTADTWHHVVATQNGGSGQLIVYVDGNSVKTGATTSCVGDLPTVSGTSTVIGNDTAVAGRFFNGTLGELRIENWEWDYETTTNHFHSTTNQYL